MSVFRSNILNYFDYLGYGIQDVGTLIGKTSIVLGFKQILDWTLQIHGKAKYKSLGI